MRSTRPGARASSTTLKCATLRLPSISLKMPTSRLQRHRFMELPRHSASSPHLCPYLCSPILHGYPLVRPTRVHCGAISQDKGLGGKVWSNPEKRADFGAFFAQCDAQVLSVKVRIPSLTSSPSLREQVWAGAACADQLSAGPGAAGDQMDPRDSRREGARQAAAHADLPRHRQVPYSGVLPRMGFR